MTKGAQDASTNIASVDDGSFDALFVEEASELVGAERYERAADRDAYHSGHYARRLITGVGEVDFSAPKLCGAVARTVRDGFAETLAYTEFPPEHWCRIKTNNEVERINREIRMRTRVVGTFPHGNSALMLVTASEVHSGARMGQEEVPGHTQAGGYGRAEAKDGGLEEDGADDGQINLRKNLDGTHMSASALIKVGQI